MADINNAAFPKEWSTIEATLKANPTPANWASAYQACLTDRIRKRYLSPIADLQSGPYQGEGFAILTIQCALIEFLAALRLGYNYELGAPFGVNYKYGQSKKLFTEFLLQQHPFSTFVTTAAEAAAFYADVRCALVHEAQTKNQWKVWAGNAGSRPLDFQRRYVNRDRLQNIIDTYIEDYGKALVKTANLQEAFLRKFAYIKSHS